MADNRKADVTLMQNMINEEVTKLNFVYRAWKWERARISNILKAKEINSIAERYWMDIFTFVKTIIVFSAKLPFWKGKITNWESFYYHYDKVFNELLKLKQPATEKKQVEADFNF